MTRMRTHVLNSYPGDMGRPRELNYLAAGESRRRSRGLAIGGRRQCLPV